MGSFGNFGILFIRDQIWQFIYFYVYYKKIVRAMRDFPAVDIALSYVSRLATAAAVLIGSIIP